MSVRILAEPRNEPLRVFSERSCHGSIVKVLPFGMIPTTTCGSPRRVIAFPRIEGSPPKRVRQSERRGLDHRMTDDVVLVDPPYDSYERIQLMLARYLPTLLAAGFCAIVAIASALLGMLPTFLVEELGEGSAAAGSATALVALSSVLGSLLAGWLLGRGAGLRALMAAGLLMPLASWPVVHAGGSLAASVLAAATLLAANGVVVAGVFAAVPRMAAAPDHLAVVNGLVAQSANYVVGDTRAALCRLQGRHRTGLSVFSIM